eukprot:TRINITY_DN1796_c0_g2_i1.p1 TRINITY_DN1796_c0_g2~~TRINITY_DN1796_c0_g2_i1.p1  ORF type:complete len:590 (-),score=234.67 TRINITY_DN1796_c0_g2_i1:67-1683(-)
MAQQYLTEVIIQVFPDDFHLATLEMLLSGICKLTPKVDVKQIVSALIDRLAKFATSSPESIPSSINVFKIFANQIQKIMLEREMACTDFLTLQVSLMNLSLKCYSSHLDYVDEVLGNTAAYLKGLKEPGDAKQPSSVTLISQLLSLPVDNFNDVLKVIALNNYMAVCGFLQYAKRKGVQVALLRSALKNQCAISSLDHTQALLSFVQALVKDEPDQPDAESIEKEDFDEEQNLVASAVHLLKNQDPEVLFSMYVAARRVFGQGGKERVRHTLPPLVFRVLQLSTIIKENKYAEFEALSKRLFQFASETIKGLATTGCPELALRLFLQAAQAASRCGLETHAYELVVQAFTIYEEEIADSAQQLSAMAVIVGTIHSLTSLEADNYDTLITKTAKHSTKLMKKTDQCRAVCMSSHLFWREATQQKDGKRVLECLQKSLKVANTCVDANSNVVLFVEILNQYLYYFEKGNECVTVKYLSGLVSLINTNMANVDTSAATGTADAQATATFYKNTLAYITWKKELPQPDPNAGPAPPYHDIAL